MEKGMDKMKTGQCSKKGKKLCEAQNVSIENQKRLEVVENRPER